jgi:hypothetical protein
MVAQTIHAAGESSPGQLPNNTFAVALAARDEAELVATHDRLTAAGVSCVLIREPDAPWSGAAMSLGVVPCDRSAVRKYLSNLPLLR